MVCKRCGVCCMSLPNWNDLPDIERALIRAWDKGAENVFRNSNKGVCSNLRFGQDGKAFCLIYDKRFKFCKAYLCKKAK